LARKMVRLRPGKSTTIPLVLRSLPSGVTGSLYILPQLTDPAGNTSFTTTATPITVQAPFIDLTGQFSGVPSTAKAGRNAAVFVTTVINSSGGFAESDVSNDTISSSLITLR